MFLGGAVVTAAASLLATSRAGCATASNIIRLVPEVWDRRVLLRNTNRFRYLSEND